MTSISIDAGHLKIKTTRDEEAVWVILQGEADIATLQHLEAALGGIGLDGAGRVHLQVAELDFADVATLRQLTAFARQARQAGRDVMTVGARPILRKLAQLMSVHHDLGLA
jgi:anti-anti-sigma regulatory factor